MVADLQLAGVELTELLGKEPEVVRDPRHHAAPVRAQQRAVVRGLDDREVLDPLLDPGGDGLQ
jgi:hypothetical protein